MKRTKRSQLLEPQQAKRIIGGNEPQEERRLSAEDIDLRDEPIREIISKPPNWLVRWGVSIIGGIVGIMLLMSFLLKYPNTLSGRIRITTTALPMSIKARSSGYLKTLRVKEGQAVNEGEVLGILENTANETALLQFAKNWQDFHQQLMQSDSVPQLHMNQKVNFGEVQAAYIQLWGSYQQYGNFMKRGAYRELLRQNNQQLEGSQSMLQQLSGQENLLKEGTEIAQKQYLTDQQLQSKGAITEREREQSKQRLQERKMALEQWKGRHLQEKLRLEELQGKAMDIRQQFERERQQYLSSLRQASLSFASAFTRWEQAYVLKASIGGMVSLFQLWTERQWIESGKEVMVISPQSEELFGQLLVGQSGAGQLKEGQKVYIKLDGYPSERFGQVKGTVKAISSIAREGKYAVQVALPHGLATTYQKTLPFHQEIEGSAEVVTEDLRLIERFFYQMKALADEH